MGLCTPAEQCRVETLTDFYPEVKDELQKIMQTVETYGQLNAVEPPADLKQKIAYNIFKANSNGVINVSEKKQTQVISFYTYMAAAASVALLISTVALYFMLSDSEKRVKDLADANEKLQTNTAEYKTQMDALTADIAFHTHIETKRLVLNAVKTSPTADAKIMVCWNEQMKMVCVEMINMPAPPQGKQYQLWVIVDGKPVDAGVMPVDLTGKAMMPLEVKDAQAFAVTIENIGGSKNPSLEQMVVMGKV
jgi:anti-sigma-K factor RskA